jgi:GT2 family glycosyltransferase
LTLTILSRIQEELAIEIIVVDNASKDKTIHSELPLQFHNVEWIFNSNNIGFGGANNLGVGRSRSSNILILNPDTIISQTTIANAIQMLENQNVGAVAVRLIDGAGVYLPESKRRFPSLKSGIIKFLGAESIWRSADRSSSYYQQDNEDGNIEVLSGACFFIRKSVYNEIGGFDEKFFMYGEDIDLSYQLNNAGYQIRYIENQPIVHFKGKSSPRTNWKFQSSFYNAIQIYWKKNVSASNSFLNSLILPIGLFLLKVLSAFRYVFLALVYPILDIISMYLSIAIISNWWAVYVKSDPNFFPSSFYVFILPLYTVGWVGALFFSKFYQRQVEISRLFQGSAIGILITLVLYFLLPSEYKFSRGILLLGIIIKIVLPLLIRFVGAKLLRNKVKWSESDVFNANFLPSRLNLDQFGALLARISNYKYASSDLNCDTIVIDVTDVPIDEIIYQIEGSPQNQVWLYHPSGGYLIESLGKNFSENTLAIDRNLPALESSSRIMKRFLDIVFSIIVIMAYPVLSLIIRKTNVSLKTIYPVLLGKLTWVAIQNPELRQQLRLKDGVYYCSHDKLRATDLQYLRNYSVWTEFTLILRRMFIL